MPISLGADTVDALVTVAQMVFDHFNKRKLVSADSALHAAESALSLVARDKSGVRPAKGIASPVSTGKRMIDRAYAALLTRHVTPLPCGDRHWTKGELAAHLGADVESVMRRIRDMEAAGIPVWKEGTGKMMKVGLREKGGA